MNPAIFKEWEKGRRSSQREKRGKKKGEKKGEKNWATGAIRESLPPTRRGGKTPPRQFPFDRPGRVSGNDRRRRPPGMAARRLSMSVRRRGARSVTLANILRVQSTLRYDGVVTVLVYNGAVSLNLEDLNLQHSFLRRLKTD